MSEDWVKKHLQGRYEGRFVRLPVNEKPELAGKGQKVLFSTGDRVIGESVLKEVSDDEIRFDPLTGVNRPNPGQPQENGYKYVDADDCGQYEIEFMTMPHEYETFKDLVRGILKKRPPTRNNIEQLQHAVWAEAQDLDLNNWSDYSERIQSSTVRKTVEEIQVWNCVFPPTDPEELVDRFKSYPKSTRRYEGLKDYVEDAADFYRERGDPGKAETLLDEVELSESERPTEEQHQVIVEKVAEA
jgi:hypothetical protein